LKNRKRHGWAGRTSGFFFFPFFGVVVIACFTAGLFRMNTECHDRLDALTLIQPSTPKPSSGSQRNATSFRQFLA